MDLWKLYDYITSVNLELHFWDLVQCLLISFCFGSEILVQFGQPQPPKNTPKHFEYELMETLRLYNFCRFGARGLGFGTVFTNIILLWIRNFEKNRTTPTPQKTPKTPQNTQNIYELMETSRLCNFCKLGDRGLEFGTMFTNIILLWIRNFGKNWTTLTP